MPTTPTIQAGVFSSYDSKMNSVFETAQLAIIRCEALLNTTVRGRTSRRRPAE
jgi:hypothetical protein